MSKEIKHLSNDIDDFNYMYIYVYSDTLMELGMLFSDVEELSILDEDITNTLSELSGELRLLLS